VDKKLRYRLTGVQGQWRFAKISQFEGQVSGEARMNANCRCNNKT
jgi:hypothetical protein